MVRKAFIIGCDRGDDRICAQSDAKKMSDALKGCGYKVFEHIGTNEESILIINELSTFVISDTDDILLFYFAGHGRTEKSGFYMRLNPSNNQLLNIVHIKEVFESEKCKSTKKLILLDCCDAGGATGIEIDHTYIIASSTEVGDIKPLDHIPGSLFTHNIVEGITGKKHIGDKITIETLWSYLKQEYRKYTSVDPDFKGHPVSKDNTIKDFEIATVNCTLEDIYNYRVSLQEDINGSMDNIDHDIKKVEKQISQIETKMTRLKKTKGNLCSKKKNEETRLRENGEIISRYKLMLTQPLKIKERDSKMNDQLFKILEP
jgi:hypothetical protein